MANKPQSRSTVKSRQKAKVKKDAAAELKRQPSKSAAAVRDAQRQADREAVDRVSRKAAEKAGRVPPVVMHLTEHEDDITDHKIGQDHPRRMKSTGPARDALEGAYIERVDGPDFEDKAALLAFNEEKIEVLVHDTTEKHASKIIETWVDGKSQRFLRNHPQVVRRKFVEALVRAKETAFSQQIVQDDNGFDTYQNNPHTAPRFPFSVVRDPNPKGAAWLRKILAEA